MQSSDEPTQPSDALTELNASPTDFSPLAQPLYPPPPPSYYQSSEPIPYPPPPPYASGPHRRRPHRRRRSPVLLIFGVMCLVIGVVIITAVLAYQAGRGSVLAECTNGAATTSNQLEPRVPRTPFPTPPPGGTWTTIKKGTGNVDQQTETLTVLAEWRIRWSATVDANGLTILEILTNAGHLVDDAVTSLGRGGGGITDNAHAMPGSFYQAAP